jgi:hypothetical protein
MDMEWKNTKTDLPNEGDRVLVYYQGLCYMARFVKEPNLMGWHSDNKDVGFIPVSKISAWMKPNPPKE